MKKILISIFAIIMSGIILIAPVFAETPCVPTSVINTTHICTKTKTGEIKKQGKNNRALQDGEFLCSCDKNGSSINHTLKFVVDVMSIGIGILGVIGITIVGIQYLTAGGSEEKTRKAKRRMFEIVIGLVAYVLIYAALKWLGVA